MGGSPVICTPSDQCHDAGVCDPGNGACSNPPKANGSPCSDDNACTDSDSCQAGACTGTPVLGPGATGGLAFADVSNLSWSSTPAASGYDVIRGTMSVLKSVGFSSAVDECVSDDGASTSISESHVPLAGEVDWYLIRAVNACGLGTYEDGSPSTVGPRDAAITASPYDCP